MANINEQEILAAVQAAEDLLPKMIALYRHLRETTGAGKTVEQLLAESDAAWDAIKAKAQAQKK